MFEVPNQLLFDRLLTIKNSPQGRRIICLLTPTQVQLFESLITTRLTPNHFGIDWLLSPFLCLRRDAMEQILSCTNEGSAKNSADNGMSFSHVSNPFNQLV